MTVVIDTEDTENLKLILKQTRAKKRESKKGSLSQHFGGLKRGIDGLAYQLDMRQDER